MNSFLILADLCIGFPLQHLFQPLCLVPWRWVLSQEPCPHSTPDLPKTRYNRYKMSWASLGQADPLCQSGYCDKQSLRGSSCTQQSWFLTCAHHGWIGALLRGSSPNWMEQTSVPTLPVTKAEGKNSGEGPTQQLNAQTWHESLSLTTHWPKLITRLHPTTRGPRSTILPCVQQVRSQKYLTNNANDFHML